MCQIELERAKDMADKLLEAGREHARTKSQDPTPEIKTDPTPSIWPDYSQGMELERKPDEDKK